MLCCASYKNLFFFFLIIVSIVDDDKTEVTNYIIFFALFLWIERNFRSHYVKGVEICLY